MPGSNTRALEKGRQLAADGLILDLEDAVAPDQKSVARRNICDALAQGGYGNRELMIRINSFESDWGHDDCVAVATSGAHAIIVPKAENPDIIHATKAILRDHGAPDDLAIWCMIETPLGVLNAHAIGQSISQANPGMGGFVMGTSDLAKDLHAAHTPDRLPMLHSLGQCLLVARACGLAILDGVHLDLTDDGGFLYSCQQGHELGFDGKTLIHPKTIDVANATFAPDDQDISWSIRIIDAFAEAQSKGQGVVVVDGKLVENLHVEDARRLVELAKAIEALT
jgi:citrate lyase subunit beta/citryl-CoA lyase